jgi:hypothetical protein
MIGGSLFRGREDGVRKTGRALHDAGRFVRYSQYENPLFDFHSKIMRCITMCWRSQPSLLHHPQNLTSAAGKTLILNVIFSLHYNGIEWHVKTPGTGSGPQKGFT